MENVLEIKDRILVIKYKGNTYEVRFPSVKESNEYLFNLKSKKENSEFENVLIDFLDKLGLPKEISENMEMSDLFVIAGKFQEEKKY